jgi:hypothetical protein
MKLTPRRRKSLALEFSFFGGLSVALMLLVGGCMTPPVDDTARVGPFYTPVNHTGDSELPATLKRVVLMPIAAGSAATSESAAALNAVFIAELQKQNRFEIVPISREECLHRFRAEEFLSTAALPYDFMNLLRREYGADGVMLIDLTAYKPYRPLVLGVRAKLATTGYEPKILWSFDNIFSASDAAVANSARHHFLESNRQGIPADLTQSALQSPSRFGSYVASTTFETLPPVHGQAAPKILPNTSPVNANPR